MKQTIYFCKLCGHWRGKNKECPECKQECVERKVPARRANMYFVDNVDMPLPSVTTILGVMSKPALEFWKIKTAVTSALTDPSQSVEEAMASIYKKRDTAGDEGSNAHQILEHIAKEGDDGVEYQGKVGRYVEAYRKFVQEMPHKTIFTEKTVYSTKHRFAGTLDTVLELTSGRRVLVDFKTSNFIAPEFDLQLKAYKMALEEMGEKTDGCAILHLKDNGTYSFIESDGDFDAFLACLKLYNWMKK